MNKLGEFIQLSVIAITTNIRGKKNFIDTFAGYKTVYFLFVIDAYIGKFDRREN